jgi:hypothetical protein
MPDGKDLHNLEVAPSAWESVPSGPVVLSDLRRGVPASDRKRPLVAGVNGPLMARGFWSVDVGQIPSGSIFLAQLGLQGCLPGWW